jgi:hypothetical protein
MLHDYITPDEKLVACPNEDVSFSVVLRADWPESPILEGNWTPPEVSRQD